jgi:hypothetical protein
LAGAGVLAVLSGAVPLVMQGVAEAGSLPALRCAAGDKIDGVSNGQAQRKMHQAGYSHITQLKKGCDNYWHGAAIKDGVHTYVALTPDGVVRSEGN